MTYNNTAEDLQAWGERELIEYILELEAKLNERNGK